MTPGEKTKLVLLNLILGAVFSYFFYSYRVGISATIFTLLSYGAFFYLLRKKIEYTNAIAWFSLFAAVVLSASIAVYNHPLTQLNILIIPVLLLVSTALFTGVNRYVWHDLRFPFDVLPRLPIQVVEHLGTPFKVMHELFSLVGFNRNRLAYRVFKSIILTIPVVAVILALLSNADPVFKFLFVRTPGWFSQIPWQSIFGHIVFGVIVFALAASYFWCLLHAQRVVTHAAMKEGPSADTVMAGIILIAVNLIYTAFVFVQFSYLFGGKDLSFLADYTYAEYARQGFGQLVVVTLLNIIITVTLLHQSQASHRQQMLIRILSSWLVLNTGIILASAFYRMWLYTQAYGYSRLRLYVHVWEVWLIMVLVMLLARIWYKKSPITQVTIVSALLVYTALSSINTDRIIARYNSNNTTIAPVDKWYILEHLSADVYKEKLEFISDPTVFRTPEEARGYFEQKRAILQATQNGWPSWNYYRQQALKEIRSVYNVE